MIRERATYWKALEGQDATVEQIFKAMEAHKDWDITAKPCKSQRFCLLFCMLYLLCVFLFSRIEMCHRIGLP